MTVESSEELMARSIEVLAEAAPGPGTRDRRAGPVGPPLVLVYDAKVVSLRLPSLALITVVGCGFDQSGQVPLADDGGPDEPDFDCTDWETSVLDPCDLPAPAGAVLVDSGAWQWDTGTGMLRRGDDVIDIPSILIDTPRGRARVASVDSFELGAAASLRVTGSYGLVLAARDRIALLGPVDASSDADTTGPGASPEVCATGGSGDDGKGPGAGGGGGGGGFGGTGGPGGAGTLVLAGGLQGGSVIGFPAGIGGGCPGGAGGAGLLGSAAAGGSGGGALVLVAYRAVRIGRLVDVGGAGGRGGAGSGGGGGGAGGMVGIDAPDAVLTNAAVVVANGGGGAEGGSIVRAGADGSDGPRDDTAAAGGSSNGSLADGGRGGFAGDGKGGAGESDKQDGGGGGGGGVGFVLDYRGSLEISPGAVVVPAVTTAP